MTRSLWVLLIASGVVVSIGLMALAIAWAKPMYRDMARRSQVVGVILSAEDVRKEIGYRVEEKKTLKGAGKGLAIRPAGPLTSASVSDDGVIVMNGTVDGYPIVVALKPRLQNGTLEWRCRGLKVVEGWFMPEGGYFPQGCPRAASLDAF